MPQSVLGLDVGGANLKAAHSSGPARSRPFALWKSPATLPDALRDLLRDWPPYDLLAVTMTGELCDCFVAACEGVRAILDAVLYARPRFKEFLVGHPAMLLGLIYAAEGRRKWALPLLIVGTIGQVSLLNTFCHIHTPLLVSAWRAGLGIGIGIVIGLLLYLFLPGAAQRPARAD